MPFKEVSSILADTKILIVTIPHLLIGYTCGFDPNTEFSCPLLKTHVVY